MVDAGRMADIAPPDVMTGWNTTRKQIVAVNGSVGPS